MPNTLDKRFLLVAQDGTHRYPVKVVTAAGTDAYKVGTGRGGIYEEVADFGEALKRVLLQGMTIYAQDETQRQAPSGVRVPGPAVTNYWLDPAFRSLVAEARTQPLDSIPMTVSLDSANATATRSDQPGAETVPARRFWVEKTIVNGRADRLQGDNALGRALWSPQRSKDGKDIYANMRKVREGDVVFHLVDNQAIAGVSTAAGAADATFVGLDGSDWAGQPGFRIALTNFQELSPSFDREAFLDTQPFSAELKDLATSGARGLFYNSSRGLNQGAYLTEATPTLLSILNRAYRELAGFGLPFVDQADTAVKAVSSLPPFSLDDALLELFLSRQEVEEILLLWRAKKNIVLQGPPGVGKSFAAHKLAFALMGAEDRQRVGFVQFHQSYSYEDFVEGYRPTDAGFELRSGKFVEFCRRAEADINNRYVFIIDEINRGNLSKILGELMLLVESDKRDPHWAMPLASGKAPFHVPANVYIMGLMNTADRSLAVVDYALRRRFGFIDLKPNLASPRFDEHLRNLGISDKLRGTLITAVQALNEEIVTDTINLGPGFAIGHSFFCSGPAEGEIEAAWYRRVVHTELLPLLREYWFDAPEKADAWRERLMASD